MPKNYRIILVSLFISLGLCVTCSCAQETGLVNIFSAPSGARVLIDGTQVGTTPLSQYRLSTGAHMYSLLKDGYSPAQQSFSVSSGETTTISINLVPLSRPTTWTTATTPPTTLTIRPTTPVPSAGSIYATTSPSGAAIYVNGLFEGYSPVLVENLAPRTYTVLARLEGYSDYARSVTVYQNSRSDFSAQLQPSPIHKDYGYISVSSSPSGAQLYVDGSYRGITPATVTEYPGNHPVVVKLAGYYDYSQTIYVTAGATQRVSATLSPVTQSGSVRVSSWPADANVYLDGSFRGQTDSSGNLVISNLPAGVYSVKVSKPAYQDAVYSVQVRQGQQSQVQASLSPISPTGTPTPTPAQQGSLSVTSNPSGAQVYIDNLFRGYTPSTYADLATGMHTLTLKLSGYEDYSTTFQISQGSTATVQASLSPAPTPTKSAPGPLAGLLAILISGYILAGRKDP
ncbi:MAG TPA: PEGA domain-containing protein [Methanoregulaceae archaeon]|nr:PEGA domain-containing protein [Methanoregulaceae archaeon]MDD5685645.1 PEGA domain-containing protein [Methanoregulaceae archaeon]HOP67296.1 PEGA domain-containing protein [Methanoregulaceae archaeon]HPJ74567.1 PEGA domain-containing protein [Methanoregulaceae archaeon]HPQ76319.1 PEGA domain-containing protein [Methanoregulaceae archaeon]